MKKIGNILLIVIMMLCVFIASVGASKGNSIENEAKRFLVSYDRAKNKEVLI